MRISDWSSDVCSSDLSHTPLPAFPASTRDALDPSHLATLFCGAEQAGSTLARELLIASAFAAPASEAGPIPLFADLTTSPFPLSTRDTQARRYFSQGLLLTYGFNHAGAVRRSDEHTSELQSLISISYAVFCLKQKK